MASLFSDVMAVQWGQNYGTGGLLDATEISLKLGVTFIHSKKHYF